MTLPRRALLVTLALLGVFYASIEIREPWRGHLAIGDQWVAAEVLRFLRAWHRDGLVASKAAMVLTPPVKQFEGPRRQTKWMLPGYQLFAYAVLASLALEPTVDRLMWVGLLVHLELAVVLALLAYALARTDRSTPRAAAWVSFHCGAFCLLLPPMLYWGQSLPSQSFTIVLLFALITGTRWLRPMVAPGRTRLALDLAVAVCVFLGLVTDFLFWILVPYWIGMRLLRTWRRKPRTADPWLLTIVLPAAFAMLALAAYFAANAQLEEMGTRFGFWMSPGGPEESAIGPLSIRLFGFVIFFSTQFFDAYSLLGIFCIALALFSLTRRREDRRLPVAMRGIFVDLLLPCLAFLFVLAPHQVGHSHSPTKYLPFVALTWTVLLPRLFPGWESAMGKGLWASYVIVSVVILCPMTNGYQRFFPVPQLAWEREADFLREHVDPGDVVFSPATEIRVLPPQRITLGERHVRHVYGPLDVLHYVADLGPDQRISIYGPAEEAAAFTPEGAEVVESDGMSLTRFENGRLTSVMAIRPYARFLRHMREVREGGFRPTPGSTGREPRPRREPIPPLKLPVGMHMMFFPETTETRERIHWQDERRFHWASDRREAVTLGPQHVKRALAGDLADRWNVVEGPESGPAAWGAFVVGLFGRPADPAARRYGWRMHEVIESPVGTPPQRLREQDPSVQAWNAYIFLWNGTPAGVAFGPADSGAAPTIAIVLEELSGDILVPGYVPQQWKVMKRPELGWLPGPTDWK